LFLLRIGGIFKKYNNITQTTDILGKKRLNNKSQIKHRKIYHKLGRKNQLLLSTDGEKRTNKNVKKKIRLAPEKKTRKILENDATTI